MALDHNAGKWPGDFFKTELNKDDLKLLREGTSEMEEAIIRMRKNRGDIQL